MSKATRPWGKCECGYRASSTTDFLRHLDAHDGVTRPGDWYKLGGSKRGYAQWDDSTSVMVHVNQKTGEIRYPGRHDAHLKDGYERQYLRSLPEVNKFERAHGVTNHVMHYDSNGRAVDDNVCGQRLTH